MKLIDLYFRDIERHINPAVVVSERKADAVKQEIEEYIFTTDIIRNLHKFLSALTSKTSGKTGVWISGYYGSGKSHFIKYLYYCLDKQYRQNALDLFEAQVREQKDPLAEVSPGEVQEVRNKLGQLEVEQLIFNIDEKGGDKNKREVITRILLNEFNGFRGYNDVNPELALLLEKPLDQRGQFAAFKARIEAELKEKWDGNQMRFFQTYLGKVVEIAQSFDANIDVPALTASIKSPREYRIADLVAEFEAFLKGKPEKYRLVILLDEVSQYIGSDTSLLLNLQTIVEEIGTKCGNKIWLACTAQQDLSNLIQKTDQKSEDFGKILGRFDTMLSLQSQDAAFITKRRLLEKKHEGLGALQKFYAGNKGAIDNQFAFAHDLYPNYQDRDDFLLTYPFVPYQFRLISDVFASFSRVGYVGEGVRDTERSILGITHFTAQNCKEEELGYFVPFDRFFNEQLRKNLAHLANNILSRAENIEEVRKDPFARRVVYVLFMVSNISESLQVAFPATVENLTLLLLDNLNQGKADLQTKVERVLGVLVDKKIIQLVEDRYRFLKEDEIEVANMIGTTNVSLDDRLQYAYDDLIAPAIVTSSSFKFNFGNNTFKASVKVDDKDINRSGDFTIRFALQDTAQLEYMAMSTGKSELVLCLNFELQKDDKLRKDLMQYLRTTLYLKTEGKKQGQRGETLATFSRNNDLLRDDLRKRFDKLILAASCISNMQVVGPQEFNGATAKARFEDIVQKHLEALYSKNSLATGYATTQEELKSKVSTAQSSIKDDLLTPAEQEVEATLLLLPEGTTVKEIVDKFEAAPFGWKDINTLDVLLSLLRKEKRAFHWRNDDADAKMYVEKALNSREREAISIHGRKGFSVAELHQFVSTVNHDIFAENLLPTQQLDADTLLHEFKDKLKPRLAQMNQLQTKCEGLPFNDHFRQFHQQLATLYEERSPERLFAAVESNKSKLGELRDTCAQAREFVENKWDNFQTFRQFVKTQRPNFSTLEETDRVRAVRLEEYVEHDNQPWEHFPEMRKIHEGLKRALDERLRALQQQVREQYNHIFDELETQAKSLDLEANVLPDREKITDRQTKAASISELQLAIAKAPGFKAECLRELQDHKADRDRAAGKTVKRAEVFVIHDDPDLNATHIETEAQLDAYLAKLRAKLMSKLQAEKTIIIQ